MNPIIIGATGGSGTRILVMILQACGVWMGNTNPKSEFGKLNHSLDAAATYPFLHEWLLPYILYGGLRDPRKVEFGDIRKQQMRNSIDYCMNRHLHDMPKLYLPHDPPRYGFKNPRCMYMLPFFFQVFPDLRFIHMIRDGRDMAWSTNQGQTGIVGPIMMNRQENLMEIPRRCALLWRKANLLVANYGETYLPNRYHRLRFEDLCSKPVTTISKFLDFLCVIGNSDILAGLVQPPDTIGRFRDHSKADIERVTELAYDRLTKFQYLKEV